jgi:peptidylprolyl isomerase
MNLRAIITATAAFLCLISGVWASDAAAADWRPLDPENALVIDTTKGRIIVELIPEAAPNHVVRIKELTRAGFYNGLIFHRVIDDFMAQTGDPQGTGQGGSDKPNLQPEFTFKRGAESPIVIVAHPSGGADVGMIKSMPIMTQRDDLMAMTADGKVQAWGLYCPGVIGMARAGPPDSANSQFFLMRQIHASLEKDYTAFGRVVVGLDVVRALKPGEPVVDPDKMVKVQILADMPAGQRPNVQIIDPAGGAFKALMKKEDVANSYEHAICGVDLPVKVN